MVAGSSKVNGGGMPLGWRIIRGGLSKSSPSLSWEKRLEMIPQLMIESPEDHLSERIERVVGGTFPTTVRTYVRYPAINTTRPPLDLSDFQKCDELEDLCKSMGLEGILKKRKEEEKKLLERLCEGIPQPEIDIQSRDTIAKNAMLMMYQSRVERPNEEPKDGEKATLDGDIARGAITRYKFSADFKRIERDYIGGYPDRIESPLKMPLRRASNRCIANENDEYPHVASGIVAPLTRTGGIGLLAGMFILINIDEYFSDEDIFIVFHIVKAFAPLIKKDGPSVWVI